jgi:DNA modification methylase
MGSGTTGVACMNTQRKFIGMESDEKYYKIAKERIENPLLMAMNSPTYTLSFSNHND